VTSWTKSKVTSFISVYFNHKSNIGAQIVTKSYSKSKMELFFNLIK